jgi:hypothetical protein
VQIVVPMVPVSLQDSSDAKHVVKDHENSSGVITGIPHLLGGR